MLIFGCGGKKRTHGLFCVLVVLVHLLHWTRGQSAPGHSCFCKLSEKVDECECLVDSVDDYNSLQMLPKLRPLLDRDFFRYYKVNMDKMCPFWPDERQCSSKECGIENCDDEVPPALKQPNGSFKNGGAGEAGCSDAGNTIDPLDTEISGEARQQFIDWADFDDAENKFCDADDESSVDAHYVDLMRNPERYTGYKGNSAARVWKSIYSENCFKPNPKFDKNFLLHPTVTASHLEGLCLEKRVFYRVISGLHTSITVSIAAHNFKETPGFPGQGTWSRNTEMFRWRFGAETTGGEGPQRLKNLYFLYLLELRALHKVAPYLRHEQLFYTGNVEEDEVTREAIENLMRVVNAFPDHFDETLMFQGIEARARELKEEFRQHFWNISRIMDCVDCDKCRLWGKLQTHGIGTALKILFSAMPPHNHYQNQPDRLPFQLTRNEVVALFNSFGRLATNVQEVAEFRRLM